MISTGVNNVLYLGVTNEKTGIILSIKNHSLMYALNIIRKIRTVVVSDTNFALDMWSWISISIIEAEFEMLPFGC